MSHDEVKLARIERKVDHVLAVTSNINTTLAVQASQLSEHMRRTHAAEQAIELIQKQNMKYAVGIIGFLAALVAAVLVHKYA